MICSEYAFHHTNVLVHRCESSKGQNWAKKKQMAQIKGSSKRKEK